MQFENGFVVNPDPFRGSTLYVSPFDNQAAYYNRQLWVDAPTYQDAWVEVNAQRGMLTASGVQALDMALEGLKLKPNDEIWIETTSGNSYVSGCVTRTIEGHCKWARQRGPNTAAVLVVHEFGFVYPKMDWLVSLGYPIIEDAAYAMFSKLNGKPAGAWGDYVVYSLAKMFPMQCGGILVSKRGDDLRSEIDHGFAAYLKACFLHYSEMDAQIVSTRLRNYLLLKDGLGALGFTPFFCQLEQNIPGAYLFKTLGCDLPKLKLFLHQQGIESSVFYGQDAFFVPCHQNMNSDQIDYMVTLIKYFVNANR